MYKNEMKIGYKLPTCREVGIYVCKMKKNDKYCPLSSLGIVFYEYF